VDDLEAVIVGRTGWSMRGEIAVYGPAGNGWSASVRYTVERPRLVDRWHAAVCDASGIARHTRMGRTPLDAVSFAEGVVARQ
jgi:hypothetical protein